MTNQPTTTLAAPVSEQERITILDSLRGIAILGILLMNIPGFGLPEVRTSDPSVVGETGVNYKTWFIIDWAFAGTQRAIFSMLFGAGMVLFITRLEKENRKGSVGWYDAGHLFFPQANVAIGFWTIQCICIAMVLGYFICICDFWNASFCLLSEIT